MTMGPKTERESGIPAGEALKTIRTRAGLRQVDLGAMFTIDQSQISSLENGKRILRLDTFVSCANACGYRLALIPEESSEPPVFIAPQTTPRAKPRRNAKGERK